MDYGFGWAWSALGLLLMNLGWAGLRVLEPIPNTDLYLSATATTPASAGWYLMAGMTCTLFPGRRRLAPPVTPDRLAPC